MEKGSKGRCRSASHLQFRDKAKNRVDDIQGIFMDLQAARKESRTSDEAFLEEQMNQMLREWKAELDQPSPASSLLGDSLGCFSADIARLLQCYEEEDDATSALAEPAAPKSVPDSQSIHIENSVVFQEDCFIYETLHGNSFQGFDQSKCSASALQDTTLNNLEFTSQLDYHQFTLPKDFNQELFMNTEDLGLCGPNSLQDLSSFLPNMSLPPSAFLGPKCALWDCPRPAQGSEWPQDYCSSYHSALASNEGPPGMTPVLRPGGIDLKDGPLFAALTAKTQGKDVGIPECAGAATTKSPWNAPELFDQSVLEGETIREWLFFDTPRRAFESGNRKQRSLPDYNGRGWHESRKIVMKEFGGLKRSYYMDPQPQKNFDWHLYEYEITDCNACALYKLQLKLTDGKKSPKVKVNKDSLADLQKRMGRLTAEFPEDIKRSGKGRMKANSKPQMADIADVIDNEGK